MARRRGGRKSLTPKQRAFVAAYNGCAATAARAVGLSASYGGTLAQRPDIIEAIRRRSGGPGDRMDPTVMSRRERQALWSRVAMDEGQDMRDRLRASELLGRSECDFVERRIVDTEITVNLVSYDEITCNVDPDDTA